MSRGGKRNPNPLLGPRLEHGGLYKLKENPCTPPSLKIKKSKRTPRTQKEKDAQLRKDWERTLGRIKSPRHLFAENSPRTSERLLNAQERWLREHWYILAYYYQSQRFTKLDRQKALARASGNIRQARILENGFEFYTVTQVLVLYGKNCHICHEPIDLKASRRVGIGDWLLGLHIDHLIAIALGGPDTLENVRPSHAICNLKKGMKAA